MKNIFIMIIVWGLLNLAAYLFAFEKGYMVSWGIFGVLLVSSVVLLLLVVGALVLTGVLQLTSVSNAYLVRKLPGLTLLTIFTITLMVMQVVVSDKFTYMPGDLEVAEWREVELNGTTQHITVRTKDESNPVILFLAGGPGGSQIQSTREHFDQLEKEYTIINWEQPGSGRSFGARKTKDITVDTYIEDGHALTTYLKEAFHQDKIYIIGESWGSYLGIELVMHYPEDYHAIITTGQMVAFAETEIACYQKAMDVAIENNDLKRIEALKDLGEVPLKGDNISLDSAKYLTYLHQYMNTIDEVNRTSWDTMDSLFSPEYRIGDSLNFMRALYYTFSQVYQQLYDTDLRETHTKIEVPIYILHGRHDLNAPTYLVDEYFSLIEAPEKELVYMEYSGHNPMINEADMFQEKVFEFFTLE